jgi:hypothetical protein
MNSLSKKVLVFSFVLLLGSILVNSCFAQQEKEKTHPTAIPAGKEAIVYIDSLMDSFDQMGLKLMGMKIREESVTRQNMQRMMGSMQNMMRDMKYFLHNLDSAAQDQKMMKDEECRKHFQEMQETMEHMIEHLPVLMENMQAVIEKMAQIQK